MMPPLLLQHLLFLCRIWVCLWQLLLFVAAAAVPHDGANNGAKHDVGASGCGGLLDDELQGILGASTHAMARQILMKSSSRTQRGSWKREHGETKTHERL